MLSVLIPVYNFDVRDFVRDLHAQAMALEFPAEIVCLDDGSDPSFRVVHEELKELQLVRWTDSPVNLGRSAVRNALVRSARYDHFLFLDCDGRVVRKDFLQRYCVIIHDYDVVYGGRVYAPEPPYNPDLLFHWTYGTLREARLAPERQQNPYRSFMTNNFMVRRDVYEKVGMDEQISTYGHEDTLFALGLMQHGFTVMHIDNPIEHLGLERAEVFLEKSAEGVRNLARLIGSTEVSSFNRLAAYYSTLKRLGLAAVSLSLIRPFEARMVKNLRGRHPSMTIFDVWKLMRLHSAAA